MRGSQAKRLRRTAKQALPEPDRNYMRSKKTGQIILGKCTRKLYQKVKQAYKNGILSETGQSLTAS
jgi:hypothetical protein